MSEYAKWMEKGGRELTQMRGPRSRVHTSGYEAYVRRNFHTTECDVIVIGDAAL